MPRFFLLAVQLQLQLLLLLLSSTTCAKSSVYSKRLTYDTINEPLKHMEYAVRGKVVILADQISDDLREHPEKYPNFDHIVYTNIGNPHGVGQKALTWPRQVLALVDLPSEVGVDHVDAEKMFPADAIRRARSIKQQLHGGTGAYSHSQGASCFRKDICEFLKRRDGGIEANPDDIFMTNGASSAIDMVFTALISGTNTGIMIPIPQYPIYTALIALKSGNGIGYYLEEKDGWGLNIAKLEEVLEEAKSKGINVNSFVLINPGNPTGQVLSKKTVQDVVRFCSKHNLVLLADEVYQENVYAEGAEFYSCKRAAHDTGLLKKDAIELISFHSVSKGLYGECGRRGGYMELVGIDEKVHEELYKLASSGLCSGLPGQVMTALMVNGPKPGDESYESHETEKKEIYNSLKRRAKIVADGLNSIDGFSCQNPSGAMYAFPSVEISEPAQKAAAEQGISPDTMYALSLLESTGICVVPASGFGQEEGRYGFRTTFLPSEEEMANVVRLMAQHHRDFNEKYSS